MGATGDTAATGATGDTAATGATGATGDQLTPEQLDAAQSKMDIRAGTAFKAVRAEAAEFKRLHEEAAAEVERLKGQTSSPEIEAELKSAKEKLGEFEKEIAIVRVEATPDYKKNIAEPLAAAEADMNSIMEKHNISLGELNAVLAETDPAKRSDRLAALSEGFNRIDMAKFDRLVTKVDELNGAKKAALAEAADKWKNLQAEQERQAREAKAEFEKNWKNALTTVFEKLQNEVPLFKKTGNAEIDKKIEDIRARVQASDIAKMPNDQLAEALYKQAAWPLVLSQITELYEKQATLLERVQKLQGTAAPVGGGDTGATGTTGPKEYKNAAEAIVSNLDGILPK
jgi:hypothetical protein